MGETTRAAVFVGADQPFEIQEFAMPDPEPNAAIIQMRMAAICGTDAHALHHPLTPAPTIFGHENIGTLAVSRTTRTDVLGNSLREGDRVLFRSAPCGRCPRCAIGEACEYSKRYGFMPANEPPYLSGGFGEYVYVQPEPWLLRIPDHVSDERALLSIVGNPVMLNGLERIGGITVGETVAIQGSGAIGMAALVQSKLAGAGQVIMVGAPPHRLQTALELGADAVIDIDEVQDPDERASRVRELTNGLGADLVIECSGGRGAVAEGIEMTRYGGRYLVVGQWTDYGDQPINPSLLTRRSLRISGVYAAMHRHIIRSLQLITHQVQSPLENLVTHRFMLDDIDQAFQTHESLDGMVAVILPNG